MSNTTFLIPDIPFTQDLSAAALSFTTTIARQFHLSRILFKLDANVTEKITITLDSAKGSAYDTVLHSRTLIGQQDYVYTPPDGESEFQSGDEIKIQMTNANGGGIVSGLVKAKELLR